MVFYLECKDCLPDRLGSGSRSFSVGVRQEQYELLAAISRQDIVASTWVILQYCCNFAQTVVPALVSISVVESLKIIQIYHQQRNRLQITCGPS